MLLFTTPSLDGDQGGWAESKSFFAEGLSVNVSLDTGRHMVSIHSTLDDHQQMAEVVSPTGLSPDDEPVSSFHLPPYYRWERGSFSCRFITEWRDGTSSVAVSLRHMASVRTHPRALVVDGPAGVPVAAIVIGTPAEAVDPDTGESGLRVDWRGWHVIDVDRILATHTAVRFEIWGQVPSSTSSSS